VVKLEIAGPRNYKNLMGPLSKLRAPSYIYIIYSIYSLYRTENTSANDMHKTNRKTSALMKHKNKECEKEHL
jgi:hypothetical protein